MPKLVADAVHGTVRLTDVEVRVMSSPAFQRLRNVKHLGLADYVYPGASFSRLSHCIGACSISNRALDALERAHGNKISKRDRQTVSLAALVHDIGHYPYSHAMERAVRAYQSRRYMQQGKSSLFTPPTDQKIETALLHEQLGKEILTRDPTIIEALASDGMGAREVASVFRHEQISESLASFSNLVSSDLDVDRLDYLLRTSTHTRLPFGHVDLDYLLMGIRLDKENSVCLAERALRSADHFLLARFFDYQQVSFHKTVVGFELFLEDVIQRALELELIDCSPPSIRDQIERGEWSGFDDGSVRAAIQQIARESDESRQSRERATSLLNRRAPKLVYSEEYWMGRSAQQTSSTTHLKKNGNRVVDELSREMGIDRSYWKVWDKTIPLIGVPGTLPVDLLERGNEEVLNEISRDHEQSIRIQRDDGSSIPIASHPRSIMNVMGNRAYFMYRIYLLIPEGSPASLRGDVEARLRTALST